jgi:hypothetical protein
MGSGLDGSTAFGDFEDTLSVVGSIFRCLSGDLGRGSGSDLSGANVASRGISTDWANGRGDLPRMIEASPSPVPNLVGTLGRADASDALWR